MKTEQLRTLQGVLVLAFSFIFLNSFYLISPDATKDLTIGSGIAGGNQQFDYKAIEHNGQTLGQFSWNDTTYQVLCVYKSADGAASLYLNNGMAVNIIDGKQYDQITVPFNYLSMNCNAWATSAGNVRILTVTTGKLTVFK